MTVDRQEWIDLVSKRNHDRIAERKSHLETIRQAAVHADLLTGDAHWDKYLTYIQAAIDAFSADLEKHKMILCDPNIVSRDEMTRHKMHAYGLECRIGVLKGAMELPSAIRKDGELAQSLLERLHG